MDCTGVASLVVAYHFGTVDDDERSAVEEHLVACTTCLKTYLALKRATERPGSGERPSPKARARLRDAVEREVRPRDRSAPRPVSLLARRIPLYQGLVAAAIAAAITLATPTVMRRLVRHDVGDGAPEVDTSRSRAASLQIY